jgi:tRNA A37 threonylcarbamoyladenosine dehydratase
MKITTKQKEQLVESITTKVLSKLQLLSEQTEQIVGYKFLVEYSDGQTEWIYVRGSGGKVGAATLHVQDMPERMCSQLLKRVQGELKREGHIYKHVETPESPYSFKSVKITPSAVLECKPVYSS